MTKIIIIVVLISFRVWFIYIWIGVIIICSNKFLCYIKEYCNYISLKKYDCKYDEICLFLNLRVTEVETLLNLYWRKHELYVFGTLLKSSSPLEALLRVHIGNIVWSCILYRMFEGFEDEVERSLAGENLTNYLFNKQLIFYLIYIHKLNFRK